MATIILSVSETSIIDMSAIMNSDAVNQIDIVYKLSHILSEDFNISVTSKTAKMIRQLPFLLLATAAECYPQFGFLGGLFGGGGGGGGGSGSTWKVADIKSIKPLYRSDAKREIVRYGPLDLAGRDVSVVVSCEIYVTDNK
jgi:hypothetical protein